MNEFHGCGAERWSIYRMQTGRIEMTSPQNADNHRINGLDCDCDHGHEKIRARCCVLVDAYASHRVLLSVIASCRSLCSPTLKLNQSLSQTTIRTRTLTLDRRQKRQMRLMTWHGTSVRQHKAVKTAERVCVCRTRTKKVGTDEWGCGKDELDEKWIDSTASFVSWLDPCPPSPSASPWLPRSDPQFRSYPSRACPYINRTATTGRGQHQTKCTNLFLNSSGTSTDGFPSAFNLASTRGFSSCAVRDGRETYGRVALHSYVKWPVNVLFDELE